MQRLVQREVYGVVEGMFWDGDEAGGGWGEEMRMVKTDGGSAGRCLMSGHNVKK